MNGVVEAEVLETKTVDDGEVVVIVTTADSPLADLVRRCRELLAQQVADGECPPGHWLG